MGENGFSRDARGGVATGMLAGLILGGAALVMLALAFPPPAPQMAAPVEPTAMEIEEGAAPAEETEPAALETEVETDG